MRWAVALAGLAAIALGVWLARSPERPEPSDRSPAPGSGAPAPLDPSRRHLDSFAGGSPARPALSGDGPTRPLAASLAGSEADGALVIDGAGRFVPTPSALRLFDYFLSALREAPLERILAQIDAAIAELPESAQADARALLEAHLTYREAARGLHAEGLGDDDLEIRQQRLRELRREIFGGETAARLFDEEERMARVALELRRIERDPDLAPEEKAARRAVAEEELPANVRAARRRARAPAELARREAALRQEGATAGEIRALREERVGPEAADRLEALDARRAAWDGRVEAYRLERDLVLEAPATGGDRAGALERLRRERFAGPELQRIRALDRIDGVEARP